VSLLLCEEKTKIELHSIVKCDRCLILRLALTVLTTVSEHKLLNDNVNMLQQKKSITIRHQHKGKHRLLPNQFP